MNEMLKKMHQLACQARQNAHVPYVDFKVGVCIRTENNRLFVGCNIQNSALPLGVCAEPAAIANMIVSGEKKIAELVLVADSKIACAPCGGCRQQISEFATPNTLIHLCDLNGVK